MEHKKYCMVYDGDSFIDGVEYDDFQQAMDETLEVLSLWLVEEMGYWKCAPDGTPEPTQEQIERYDYMIDNCCCYVLTLDEETGEYCDADYADYPSDEQLKEIGWVYYDEMMKEWEKQKPLTVDGKVERNADKD